MVAPVLVKGALLIAGLFGLALVASDSKSKQVTGPAPGGGQLPKNTLCQAPNGAIIICHEMQPWVLAQLANQVTTLGSGNTFPTVGLSSTPQPGAMPVPALSWVQGQLAQGRIVLIAVDGRRELMAVQPGQEVALCPRSPLRNAVLVEPGDSLPGAQAPGTPQQPPAPPGVPQGSQGQGPTVPGSYPGPNDVPPGGDRPMPPTPGGFGLPDFSSPTPPANWPSWAPWPGAMGGGQPAPVPPGQPAPPPAPQPGPAPQNGAPPGWPASVPWPGYWPPGMPFPPALPGGGVPSPGPSPGPSPVPNATVYQGPDGLWRHVIRPGDIASKMAVWYAGGFEHTRELEKTNPELVLHYAGENGTASYYTPWKVGQVLVLPANWNGAKGPPQVDFDERNKKAPTPKGTEMVAGREGRDVRGRFAARR